jgi:hypothetical protein
MKREQYNSKLDEVLAKFSPAFKEKYMLDPYANVIVETLVRDGNIYEILEKMVDNQIENNKKMIELIQGLPPRKIILTTEEFKDFKEKN